MKIRLNIEYIEDAPRAKLTDETVVEAMAETVTDTPEKAFGFCLGQHIKYHGPFNAPEFLKHFLMGLGTIPFEED